MTTAQPSTRGDVSFHTVILAAGLGSRLWPLTRECPKPLLDLGEGRTILGTQLDVLDAATSVRAVTVVTGHLSEQIDAFVASRGPGKTTTRYNPFYELAGPLGSVWAIRDVLAGSDCLITNGDTVFDPSLLDDVIERSGAGGVFLVGSECDSPAPDDVGVDHDRGCVRRVGKGLEHVQGRSAGVLAVLGQAWRNLAVQHLDAIVRDTNALVSPWHGWVHHMATSDVRVEFLEVAEKLWAEVDLHPELDDLRSELAARWR